MGAQLLIRRWVGVETLVKNNEIAGFKFATVGVIYAVLVAFTVIVVWEKFSDAENAVAQEAGATAALFQYAEGKEPEALALRTALANYVQFGGRGRMAGNGQRDGKPGRRRARSMPCTDAALALNRSRSGTRRIWRRSSLSSTM